MTIDLRYYLSIFLSRLPLFVLVAGLIGGVGVGVSMTLPPAYISRAQLVIEPPQIPQGMVGPTITIDPQEQLEMFQTQLLTRANMLDIARKLNVLEGQNEMSPDQIVAGMRSRTQIRRRAGSGRTTSMNLQFEARAPQIAANVLNEYLTLILQADTTNRTERASQTEDFFAQEVQRLNDELNAQSARIIEFKQANADALPESLDYRRSQQLATQERITDANRELNSLRDQRQRLVDLYESTGRVTPAEGATLTASERERNALQRQLSDALLVYSETNPNVLILKRRIDALEERIAAEAPVPEVTDTDPAQTIFEIQLAELDSRISSSEELIGNLQERLDQISESITRTPANSLTLTSMQRDYQNLQNQYNGAVQRQAQASTGERVALLARGERVTVVEQPTVPSSPAKPDRPKIAAAGVGLGIAAGLGLIVLLELLNTTARRPGRP